MKNYITILLLAASSLTFAQKNPAKNWLKYKNASEAGFSEKKLAEVENLHTEIGGGALMVIYDGNIVLSKGETTRKFMDHSMRKSYLSALFGIHEATGEIDLNESLASLGIDDVEQLSEVEKKATVADLLAARSGVYHQSAYSPRGMKKYLPERGSHEHGTFWYYNNWDFNTLATIFKQKTGTDLFEAFNSEIAIPLGMEDFKMEDTFYRYEDVSEHPAYLFRLSARDEARFGLLYANGGKWNGNQLIPKKWIEKSTSAITTEMRGFESRGGYGYLWWKMKLKDYDGYRASGTGGQTIAIFPEEKIVIIQSTNTYDVSKSINDDKIIELIKMTLDARTNKPNRKPSHETLKQKQLEYPNFKIDSDMVQTYIGDYKHRFIGTMSISFDQNQWLLKTSAGKFKLYPKSNSEFIPEEILFPLVMRQAETPENKRNVIPITNPDRSLINMQFMY